MVNESSLLQAALVGYQNHLEEINRAIAEIQQRLGGRAPNSAKSASGRRQLSAAARKRIADAQKKRWAAFHKDKKSEKTAK